jgi:signal transduction histidine kinase
MAFRLVQESLVNVVKHARATDVHVEIAVQGDELMILVQDNGGGIDADRREAVGSHGLATMRHRVRSFGGTFEIECPPQGGTRVRARLPLAAIVQPPAPLAIPSLASAR